MTNINFDHFITYASADNIDDYIQEYAAQGFIPDEQTVRHEPGLRNRFIFLGVEYIEFCWVEDEELFTKGDDAEKSFRSAARPFGIGMVAEDIQAIHDDWTKRGRTTKKPCPLPCHRRKTWRSQLHSGAGRHAFGIEGF